MFFLKVQKIERTRSCLLKVFMEITKRDPWLDEKTHEKNCQACVKQVAQLKNYHIPISLPSGSWKKENPPAKLTPSLNLDFFRKILQHRNPRNVDGKVPFAPDKNNPWESPNDWGQNFPEKRNSKWRSFFISSSFSFKRCSSHRNSEKWPYQNRLWETIQ